ncbi:MAG: O-methyltransferase [Lachnospiraceae bacterium]|nr:O-methyltransferase [Lachnospiraceae bacterium]
MIVDENLTKYLHSLEPEGKPFFEDLRQFAEETGVPIIRREMESFLRLLLHLSKPERLLEIGTGIGYSTLFFADNSESLKEIVTMENYEPRLVEARKNIAEYTKDKTIKINLMEGDAAESIKTCSGSYDLIFLDGPKAQYIHMLPTLLELMPVGGLLIADNVLQEGDIIDSRYITPRRQRTIHERMRGFIWEVKHNENLETTMLTVGDGVTVSRKIR